MPPTVGGAGNPEERMADSVSVLASSTKNTRHLHYVQSMRPNTPCVPLLLIHKELTRSSGDQTIAEALYDIIYITPKYGAIYGRILDRH